MIRIKRGSSISITFWLSVGSYFLLLMQKRPSGTLTIGTLISQARAEEGLSQAELAKLIGMKQSAVARLERADHRHNVATLERVAKALGRELQVTFPEKKRARR